MKIEKGRCKNCGQEVSRMVFDPSVSSGWIHEWSTFPKSCFGELINWEPDSNYEIEVIDLMPQEDKL